MAKRKSSTKSSAVKAQISALRRKGLTRAKPKGRPGGSAYALIRKLKPVLEKHSQAIKVDKATAEKYKGIFPVVKGKAIVPVFKGEKVSVSKKKGEIRKTRTYNNGSKRTFRVLTRKEMLDTITGDENTVYRVHTVNKRAADYYIGSRIRDFIDKYSVEDFVTSIEMVTADDMKGAAA